MARKRPFERRRELPDPWAVVGRGRAQSGALGHAHRYPAEVQVHPTIPVESAGAYELRAPDADFHGVREAIQFEAGRGFTNDPAKAARLQAAGFVLVEKREEVPQDERGATNGGSDA
jgi:hypothetical protein